MNKGSFQRYGMDYRYQDFHFIFSSRFWYENPGVFEPNQLAEIQQVTLAQVICESSDEIKRVQKDVFIKAEIDEDYHECSRIPKLNLRTWSDCCTSGYFNWKRKMINSCKFFNFII